MPPPINLPNVLGQTPQVDVPDQLFKDKGQALALATLLTFRPELGGALLGQQQQRQGAIQRAQATNVGLQQQSNIAKATQRRFNAEQKRLGDISAENLRRFKLGETSRELALEKQQVEIDLLNARITELKNRPNTDPVAKRHSDTEQFETQKELFNVYRGPKPLFRQMIKAFNDATDDPNTNEDERFLAAMGIFQEADERSQLSVSNPMLIDSASASLGGSLIDFKRETIERFNDWLTKKTALASKFEAQRIRRQTTTQQVREKFKKIVRPPVRGPK